MALQPIYSPVGYHSVYRPVTYRLTSTDYLEPNPFQATAQVVEVRLPDAAEQATYGIPSTAVLVQHTGAAIIAGQLYKIPGSLGPNDVSGTSRYPDTYRVDRVLSSTLIVISATYVGFDTTGGYLFRILGNYTVFARVSGPHIPVTVEYALRPVLEEGVGYVFELDARDVLARHFKDVKAICDTSSGALVDGAGYITQRYTVDFYAGYDVVTSTGITFTRFDTVDDPAFSIANQICVNAVHPYHHVQRDGSVDFDYVDADFTEDYLVTGVNAPLKRFLTYMDRSKNTIRVGDSFFLAFLNNRIGNPERKVSVTFDNESTFLGTITLATSTAPANSFICNVGRALDQMPAGATRMKVTILTGTNAARTETFTLNIVACKGVNKRWYYLNKLGGVDAFTFEGDETRQMSVSRQTISKPSMRLPEVAGGTYRGDWQQRVWRTEPMRKYTLTSGYLLPVLLRNIAEEMFESPNIWTEVRSGYWTNIIPLTNEVPGDSDTGRAERFVIQYMLGVDNLTQRT